MRDQLAPRLADAPRDEAAVVQLAEPHRDIDAKLDALAKLVRNIAIERGHADPALVEAFFAAGWTKGHLVDVIVTIGDKTVTNYLHATTHVPVDFPPAPKLD